MAVDQMLCPLCNALIPISGSKMIRHTMETSNGVRFECPNSDTQIVSLDSVGDIL